MGVNLTGSAGQLDGNEDPTDEFKCNKNLS